MAVLIQADGSAKTVRPANGEDFQGDEVHALIGGDWEVVRPGALGMVLIAQGDNTIVVEVLPDSLLVVDEYGKIKELPVNPLATEIYSNPLDTINGVCLLCGPGEIV